jgi:hypothetical protein
VALTPHEFHGDWNYTIAPSNSRCTWIPGRDRSFNGE